MRKVLIVHYGEIGLKKANKDYFVGKLRKCVKLRLEQRFRETLIVKHTLGRLLVELPEGFSDEDEAAYVEVLRKIFGIKSFKFCFVGTADIDGLGERIWKNLPERVLKGGNRPANFRVLAKRSMDLPFKSNVAEREIGAILLEKGIDLKVKLKNPDFTVDVEYFNDFGYYSFFRYIGLGGFPCNSQGKLVSLISSGIDSPVASYRMMRRGARVIFVHFHGYPYTDRAELEQTQELVEMLSGYQFDTKLYLIAFGEIQKRIASNLNVPAKVRTVLYRRMMIRIAETIAKKERAKGLVTGDNFGQVASQTPENMYAIHEVSSIPVYQPLIGYDKEEIVRLSEEIGAFDVSRLPCRDSCSMFMPEHPEIKANVYDLCRYEEVFPIEEWVVESLDRCEIVNY